MRTRINVLSEIPDEWRKSLARWSRMNRSKRVELDGGWVPDFNEEYLLYQTLVGTWPDREVWGDEKERLNYVDRIVAYTLKACKEAKINTNWINPQNEYEDAVERFIRAILEKNHVFVADFTHFEEEVIEAGMCNSLSQVVLKVASPGIPDFYQGTELWDYSLVDPDNRRPVDYASRAAILKDIKVLLSEGLKMEVADELVRARRDGRIKLYVTFLALNFRLRNRPLFEKGQYLPLFASGDEAESICAFARIDGQKRAIVAAPRFLTRLDRNALGLPFGPETWKASFLDVPFEEDRFAYKNLFTDEILEGGECRGSRGLFLKDIFVNFPVAILEKWRAKGRKEQRTEG